MSSKRHPSALRTDHQFLDVRLRCLCVCTHKQRYVYLAIMYSGTAESLAATGL